MNSHQQTIGIIGGGISGLSAAHRAMSRFPDARVVVFESSDRLGGVLQTESIDGYLVESSADMFATNPPAAIEFCRELGTENHLLKTLPTPDRAFVATASGFHPVSRGLSLLLPTDLTAIEQSPLLDAKSKQRFLAERDVPPRDWIEDESLESFAIRRFGQAAFDHLFQPLVGGIYTADPKRLSMQATMNRFVELEKQYGSLIRAGEATSLARTQPGAASASGARYDLFRAPPQGIGQLIDWLRGSLAGVEFELGCPVTTIEKTARGWQIASTGRPPVPVDGLVLATSASVSAQLVRPVDRELANRLARITAASSAVVVLGLDLSQVKQQQFHGYGIIVPACLNRQVIATSFSSNKFPGRAPEGKMLVRTFIGGALQANLVDLPDDQLVNIALDELEKTVGLTGPPELTRVYRWRNCMPQYHLGHLELVREIETLEAQHPGLQLAGNSYRGVGIPACIQSGHEAIDRLAASIADD